MDGPPAPFHVVHRSLAHAVLRPFAELPLHTTRDGRT